MLTVPVGTVIIFAGILFFLGLVGLLVRRNMIFMLMSIEVMFNSAGSGIYNCRYSLEAARRTGNVYFYSCGYSC